MDRARLAHPGVEALGAALFVAALALTMRDWRRVPPEAVAGPSGPRRGLAVAVSSAPARVKLHPARRQNEPLPEPTSAEAPQRGGMQMRRSAREPDSPEEAIEVGIPPPVEPAAREEPLAARARSLVQGLVDARPVSDDARLADWLTRLVSARGRFGFASASGADRATERLLEEERALRHELLESFGRRGAAQIAAAVELLGLDPATGELVRVDVDGSPFAGGREATVDAR
jgi:hypothetical protein